MSAHGGAHGGRCCCMGCNPTDTEHPVCGACDKHEPDPQAETSWTKYYIYTPPLVPKPEPRLVTTR